MMSVVTERILSSVRDNVALIEIFRSQNRLHYVGHTVFDTHMQQAC
jgi:hypothetical protein